MSTNENRKLATNEMGRLDIDEFKQEAKHPIVIVLDSIRSMHNVGSAFRTGDAFLVEKVCLCGITATPPHREIHKTALGATETVVWEHHHSIEDALTQLKNEGYQLLLAEQTTQSVALQDYRFDREAKYAFVFGNEAFGVSDEALPLADACLEIPQFGTKHSLNVSVSIGICLWEYLAQTQVARNA